MPGMSAAPDTSMLGPVLMAESAEEPGFALLRDGSSWRLYRNPSEILVASDADSLTGALRRVEEHVKRGCEAAGLLRYEAGYALEPRFRPLLARATDPLAWFGLYASCTILADPPFLADDDNVQIQDPRLAIARDKYCAKIAEIRQLIEAGEVYQINFTTRVEFATQCSAWELFCALVRRHPVPYAAFLNLGDEQIVSLSPELFFQIEQGRITVRPMKGTAPRGRTLEEDISAGEGLRSDEKNRAENVMIVDLMRNDLGRICRTGSVKTPKLFDVERYPSVWQMTSTVEGELVEGCTIESIVRALFPSGSVTGAPKIRAMEHIAALEASPRGAYTGAIGFFAPQRSCFNVAIRTVTLRGQSGTMGVGGGITHSSSASAEWEECQWKAAFLTQSEPEFKILETTLWDGEYRFLENHLARMRDSAEYFGFGFDEQEIREALQDLAAHFPRKPQRVRITLAQDGTLEIEHRDYVDERFGRVRISNRRVSGQDRFLYHKTTNRRLYDAEFSAARKARCDDALFFNERGELTEGAIHNVFVVKDAMWRTPPVSCGLLPGTCRAQILRDRPNACEAILTIDDLLHADAIYLCNSVRGIYPVELIFDDSIRSEQTTIELRESAHDSVK
jgi:para-aminobenzoate synthetase / 4-amino-4-deoxychorismate lyase